MLIADKNITGMHVRMEEAIAEHLGKEHLNPAFGQQFHVGALLFQRWNIRNRNSVDALHDQHAFAAVIGVNLRHIQHRATVEIASQLDGVGRFTQQVQLVQQGLFIFAHHFTRT
ncbi:hypothetical protein D3C79_247570 [compost metagenome]